jgi:hypothetical protein
MPQTASHILFDYANTDAKNTDENEAMKAIDTMSDEVFYSNIDNASSSEEGVCIECHCHDPIKEEIHVLEIAFHKGKLRKTKFSVEYIDSEDKKHHIGTYQSSGESSNYEKFLFPDKIKNIKAIVLKFKSNNDGSPIFAVKGVRLARFIEKTL